jgi:hypothetical protein
MNIGLAQSLVLLACVGAIAAQEQATTLAEACRRADTVAIVEVVAATDPSPEWHRLVLRVDERLAGAAPAQVAVLEPAGACCGRSLFALGVGDRRLVFLSRVGNAWHPFAGDRGVLPAEPELVEHVRGLLAAGDPAAKGRLLARALADTNPRIARDAALALAAEPELALGPAEDEQVAAALRALLTARSHPRAQLHLVEAMLAAGHRREALTPLVPAPVLRLAERRRAAGGKWRNVDGGGR